ncbi:MAG TPA: hypothetical protein VGU61_05915 [Noviherbaspirillum sp.]|uniref:hypothetical protein n=1 Tax=Noviherbaspirillum sp. TaxID=1926288 RepID=UPI002DDDAFAE|nr:hypothetical protein [Noviherbaspirillum sp.]HEV2609785.1 hypothetical protein [Noviherbaspirillum sp.]
MLISNSLAEHADWVARDAAFGFERFFLHNVLRDQRRLLSESAQHVMPLFT